MRNRRLLAGMLCAAFLTGCSAQSGGLSVKVYYPGQNASGELETTSVENTGGEDMVERLYKALCTPPDNENLVSPIPAGAQLQSWSVENGILTLDLSGEYSTLSGVDLTIADCCIVLTMCQLENVDGVSITADGENVTDTPVLTPDQIMLTGGEGDTGLIEAKLYFPMEDGGIGYEERSLSVSENRSASETLLNALCQGPESKELTTFLPEDATGITLWTDAGICYVNLTADWESWLEGEDGGLKQRLLCITNTLTGLDSVSEVQFLMDGAALEQWTDIGGDFPMEPDTTGCTAAENE